jgi:hypothetical protein
VYVPPQDTAPAGKDNYFEVRHCWLLQVVPRAFAHRASPRSSLRAPTHFERVHLLPSHTRHMPCCGAPQVRVIGPDGGRSLCVSALTSKSMADFVNAVNDKVGLALCTSACEAGRDIRTPAAPSSVRPCNAVGAQYACQLLSALHAHSHPVTCPMP